MKPRTYFKQSWFQFPEIEQISQTAWVQQLEISGYGSVGVCIDKHGEVEPFVEIQGNDFLIDEL